MTDKDFWGIKCEDNNIGPIIPGNTKKCTNNVTKGDNFLWGNWMTLGFLQNKYNVAPTIITLFVIKNLVTNEFKYVPIDNGFNKAESRDYWQENVLASSEIKDQYTDYIGLIDGDYRVCKLLTENASDRDYKLSLYDPIYNFYLQYLMIGRKYDKESKNNVGV
jgi:hypothetical protein